jgi:glycosyltransferase involved in cell wall biosynthesis
LRLLQERKIEVLCKVVGSAFSGGSKPTPYVKALLSSHPSNVEFVGYRAQTAIAEEYRTADILCCPSIFQDPFPGVPLEGMASGLPIVATTVGGIPEMAAGGGFLLVEPSSAVKLADALGALVVDKILRAKIGAEGLNNSRRNFAWSAIYSKHHRVITHLSKASALEHSDSKHAATLRRIQT